LQKIKFRLIFAAQTKKCRVGQGVKTPPFHGGITGSNPVHGTKSLLKVGTFFMVTVYVLLSEKDGSTYVGMALDAHKRLREHNAGKNRYTKGHLPWKIIYTEIHPDWTIARVREKYLKSSAGKNWLRKYFESIGGITGFPA
jgi:putative endonuclease